LDVNTISLQYQLLEECSNILNYYLQKAVLGDEISSKIRDTIVYRAGGSKVISDGELTAMTLMIAESNPLEKEIMTTMVMNFLTI
jgi:hypothetical protein